MKRDTMDKRPLIFITNDDGVQAPGVQALAAEMRELGDVVVVCPDSAMSGMSHAITVKVPLRIKKHHQEEAFSVYSCNGTPVDSTKLAGRVILDRKPDLLVSGINHGSNAAINVIYSGTMGAVLEGNIEGIPSIGFSICDFSHKADLSAARKIVRRIAEEVLQNGLPDGVCLNVNIPAVAYSEIRGIKTCKQARGHWEEDFDTRTDPQGRTYYWLTGDYQNGDNRTDTDEWALKNNYVSVVPVQHDLTAHRAIDELNQRFSKNAQ